VSFERGDSQTIKLKSSSEREQVIVRDNEPHSKKGEHTKKVTFEREQVSNSGNKFRKGRAGGKGDIRRQ
jgi:hypothetical protein